MSETQLSQVSSLSATLELAQTKIRSLESEIRQLKESNRNLKSQVAWERARL